ncbi:MAG: anthranilate phosphoribosyltransferase [Deltaproteobacteria bacterium]|nr:anthranilate phosphoribosyltransferase [Candidatus Zymogenaceae bacterium]
MIKFLLEKVADAQDLSFNEMETAMEYIMTGRASPAQIGAFVTGLRLKGETVQEIAGAAAAMRKRAVRISPRPSNGNCLLDTCGTGGDSSRTFNISTAAAFVAAGAGARVAKHGNRGVSSRSGSADVLEALGVDITIEPERVKRCIEEVGIGFLFAPRLHAAMKHVSEPRKELGFRTIFNILGPLTNPAGAEAQLLGVYDPALCHVIAEALITLGTKRAMIVHGDGLDEITTAGPTSVSYVHDGMIDEFILNPERYGITISRVEDLMGGTPAENAQIIEDLLRGLRGPKRDVTLLNAAAGLMVSGVAADLEAGLAKAEESVDSGAAYRKLYALRDFTAAPTSA